MQRINIDRAKEIKGWMSDSELTWLGEQAKENRLILEVGSYHGRSTRALADNLVEGGMIFCVDPWNEIFYDDQSKICWRDPTSYNSFLVNLHDKIESNSVYPFRGILADFPAIFKFDFIFIDGDHRYSYVKDDLTRALNLLSKNGLIAGHDYIYNSWPGVKQAVNEVIGKPDFLVDSIWIKKY
jgi:hypothetical protein